MKKVQSADGTTIAFDQLGKGPALILVGGALEQRAMDSETAQLAPLLAQHFTVFHYDRRGRGDSTDTPPYAVEREKDEPWTIFLPSGSGAPSNTKRLTFMSMLHHVRRARAWPAISSFI